MIHITESPRCPSVLAPLYVLSVSLIGIILQNLFTVFLPTDISVYIDFFTDDVHRFMYTFLFSNHFFWVYIIEKDRHVCFSRDGRSEFNRGSSRSRAPSQSNLKGNCIEMAEEIKKVGREINNTTNTNNHHGICAICLNKIELQETALVKGCEHGYCVNCILKWASCKMEATCPQCKNPFEFLNIHRGLDGSIHDYMFEESVCLLLRASWFKPLVVVEREEVDEETEDYYYQDDEEEALDEVYLDGSSGIRLGNRRWGDYGYVRGGRLEARPAYRPNPQDVVSGPSCQSKKEGGSVKEAAVGRRAKRTLKREAAVKAASDKHEKRLARLGRV